MYTSPWAAATTHRDRHRTRRNRWNENKQRGRSHLSFTVHSIISTVPSKIHLRPRIVMRWERSELFAASEQEVLRTPSACGCPDAKRTPTRGEAIGPLMGIAKEKPGGIKCGSFGCPLPNLHSGLCQPCVATRFSRRSGAVSGSRRGCPGYVRRPTIVFKPKTEFPYHPTYVGPRHQVDYVPACSPSYCTHDRGDVRILLTATEVRAHMDAERAAAAAWQQRVMGKQSSSMERSGSPSQSEVKIEKVPSTPLKTSNPNVNLASARARPALSFVNTRHRSMIGS